MLSLIDLECSSSSLQSRQILEFLSYDENLNSHGPEMTTQSETRALQRQSVILIPWDPNSTKHFERMVAQRVACGWKQDYVEGWRQLQREGKIGLHWIVGVYITHALPIEYMVPRSSL